eukprot:6775483-Prymnesium_polylepis.1
MLSGVIGLTGEHAFTDFEALLCASPRSAFHVPAAVQRARKLWRLAPRFPWLRLYSRGFSKSTVLMP